jgi:parallel beta-helix repeat protein
MSGSNDNEIVSCQSNNNGNVKVRAHPILGSSAWGQFEAFGILVWEESSGAASERNHFLACTTNGNEKHGIELLGSYHKDNLIMGCTAIDNNGYGIILNSEGATHASSIVACTCLDNAEAGIGAFGDSAHIEGNFLSRNGHGHFRGYLDTPAPVNSAGIGISGNLCTISNNHVIDAITDVTDGSVQGITVSGDYNRVIGNLVSKTQQRGILFGGKGNIIADNTVLHAGNTDSTIGIGIQGNYSTNAIISSNIVQFSSFDGIYFAGVGGTNRISGNQINNNGGNGISIIEQHDCIIGENICLSNGTKRIANNTYGILIHTSLRDIISGNRCGNNDQQKTQDIGIAMVGPSDQAIITGNILVGNNAHSIQIAGTGNIIQLNMQDN